MINRIKRRKKKGLSSQQRQRMTHKRRSLRHENLEDRNLLTLLGVDPLGLPSVGYNVDGSVNYDSTTNTFTLDGTPTTIETTTNPFGLFFSGDIDINIEVDETGALVGGSVGDDFVLTGDVDTTGDFIVDTSGVLLTGEVTGFGFEETGGISDLYDFRFTVTGGALAGLYAGMDIGVTTTSENSTFTGDFNVDFSGEAKGAAGAIDPLVVLTPNIEIEKLVNGENADTLETAAQIEAGDTVYFTYRVTNTGDVDFAQADVVVTDDNGTPADLSDDVSTTSGDITLIAASDDGADGILSVGETWQYQYTSTAEDLTTLSAPVTVDFEGLSAGTIIGGGNQPVAGLTVESENAANPAMIFDTANPTGGDHDLATPGYGIDNDTPLGNVLILSEDGDTSDPDDNAGGGVLVFTWDELVTLDNITMLDIDSNEAGGTIATFFDEVGGVIGSVAIPALGDNSVQTIAVNMDGVKQMKINMVSSGAVAELVYRTSETGFYKNTAVVTAPDVTDSDMAHYVNPDSPLPPAEGPKIAYDVDGSVTYDSTTDVFSLDATPTSLSTSTLPFGLFFDGDFDINIVVDENGDLVSGVGGDDLVLAGTVDTTGDFIPDFSGVLLTGEIVEFTATDSGGISDTYGFRFVVTGGLLAPLYADQDLFIETTSENSSFMGDFTIDFGGEAKGQICAVDPIVQQLASIGNYVFIDNNDDGIQNTGDQGVNGITVNLLNGEGILVASTVTDFDASGNAGFYLFYNLDAGDYIVEFEVPEGVQFTLKDAGTDDTRDSDVDGTTNRTDIITVADGEHRRDIDAGVRGVVETESMVYKVEDFVNRHQNKKAGKVKSLDIEFSEATNELFVSVDFKAYRGRLTDGFTIVITPGEWPAGTEDKYAIFYFDADIYNRQGGPVLNVFGYNGKYNAQSYRDSDGDYGYDPDRIATSTDNSDGWVKELSVDTYRHHGRWHRTMTFRIDATKVNDHVPLQGGDWGGSMIGNMASFALDTYDGLYTKYNSEGYLKKWWACRHGWMDGDWVTTTCDTVVTEQPVSDFFSDFGWTVTDYAGDSDGDPPTDIDDEISDLDWAGSVDVALEEVFA